MPMLDISHKPAMGFTLIELLVVMALISTVTAIAFPGFERLYRSVVNRSEMESIIVGFNRLGVNAYQKNEQFQLTSASAGGRLVLAQGWRFEIPSAIFFYASGACSGGDIRLIKDDKLMLAKSVKPPYCQIENEK